MFFSDAKSLDARSTKFSLKCPWIKMHDTERETASQAQCLG